MKPLATIVGEPSLLPIEASRACGFGEVFMRSGTLISSSPGNFFTPDKVLSIMAIQAVIKKDLFRIDLNPVTLLILKDMCGTENSGWKIYAVLNIWLGGYGLVVMVRW